MSELSRCPSCDRWVGIPGGLDALSTVRCPMCHEQYTLQRVLDSAPPLLQIVAPGPFASSVASSGHNIEATEPVSDGADKDTARGGMAASAETPASDIDQTEASAAGHGTSTSSPPPAMEVRLSAESLQDRELPDLAPVATLSKRRSSVLAKMVGVVGGGIMGLAIGYLILLWIGGPEKDFLDISHELPQWMLPVEFRRDDPSEFDAFRGSPARAEPATSSGAWQRRPTWRSIKPAPEARPMPSELSLPRARPETGGLSRLSSSAQLRSDSMVGDSVDKEFIDKESIGKDAKDKDAKDKDAKDKDAKDKDAKDRDAKGKDAKGKDALQNAYAGPPAASVQDGGQDSESPVPDLAD